MEQKKAIVCTFGETAYRIGAQLQTQGRKKLVVKNFMHPKDDFDGRCIVTVNEEAFKKNLAQSLAVEQKQRHWLVRLWQRLTSCRKHVSRKMVIVAGLGGNFSSKYAPMAAQVAASMGYQVVSVVQLPFKFEGEMRRQRAEEALNLLKKYSQKQLVLDHRDLSRKYREMELSDYFRKIDNAMLKAISEEV